MITVGIPAFNAKEISWLALESFCNQKDVPCEWELVYCEEQNEHMLGYMEIMKYDKRLRSVGCKCLKYIPINEWINLSKKWNMISENRNPNYRLFMLQGADNYAQPFRIKEAHDLFKKNPNIDMIHQKRALYYGIKQDRTFLLDFTKIPNTIFTGLDITVASKLLKKGLTPPNQLNKRNDGWFIRTITRNKGSKLKTMWNETDKWNQGLFTRGISFLSAKDIFDKDPVAPWYDFTGNLRDTIPHDILDRLLSIRNKCSNPEYNNIT